MFRLYTLCLARLAQAKKTPNLDYVIHGWSLVYTERTKNYFSSLWSILWGDICKIWKKKLQLILSLILPLGNILHWFLWKVVMNFFSHICHSPFDHCKIDANDDKWNQHSKQSVEGHTLAGFFCKIDWLTITQIWVLGQIETIIMPKTISLISALPPKKWLNPKSARALFC